MRLGYRMYFAMKPTILILTMSVVSLSAARAEDASTRSLQFAQAAPSKAEHQPVGACTPIGLTANGDIVFPWECRETIERQRGPISISLPNPPNGPPSREPSPDARREDAVATAATVQPKVEETMRGSASSPEVHETSALVKPRLPVKLTSDLGPSRPGRKGQHTAALPLHQASNGPAIAKKKDTVALQPAAAQK